MISISGITPAPPAPVPSFVLKFEMNQVEEGIGFQNDERGNLLNRPFISEYTSILGPSKQNQGLPMTYIQRESFQSISGKKAHRSGI